MPAQVEGQQDLSQAPGAEAAGFDEAIAEVEKAEAPRAKGGAGFAHENPVGGSVDWFTPPYVFKTLGLKFTFDPCHSPRRDLRVPWIPVGRVFTAEDNGLTSRWGSPSTTFWGNPPYDRRSMEAWMAKFAAHRNGITLTFARCDTAWFQDSVAPTADAILFVKGRIPFMANMPDVGFTFVRNVKGILVPCPEEKADKPGAGSILTAWQGRHVDALRDWVKQLGGHILYPERTVDARLLRDLEALRAKVAP